MTDRETIFAYRMRQTEETLSEAIRMLEAGFSPRSIVNRSYYAMFYAVLALFIHCPRDRTSLHHKDVVAIRSSQDSSRS